jgi:predicted transcriptional regulator
MDAVVETSSGVRAHLAPLFRRPTVLFYEDKDATPVNQHVKDALYAVGRERGLLESVTVVAVANVAAFDWFPARDFVLAAVRDIERKVHVPVYLDFKGALAAPPWNLSPKSSTVLVLNASGEVVWKVRGRLRDDEVKTLFDVLDRLLSTTH